MRFEGITIFVTGGAGFIGSAVIRHLMADTGARIVNIDKLTYAANLDSLPGVAGHPRYAFERQCIGESTGLWALFEKYQPDAVILPRRATSTVRSTARRSSSRPTWSAPLHCFRRRCGTGED
jgi:dTDP-D-glucose 4,6-dehydratase